MRGDVNIFNVGLYQETDLNYQLKEICILYQGIKISLLHGN